MVATLQHINKELVDSYTTSLREEPVIDDVLDHINEKKNQYKSLIKGISKLSLLLFEITWLNDLQSSDEVIIKGILAMGKEADIFFRRDYASEHRKYAVKGWFKEEFHELKTAIDLHNETVLEVEHIIFDLRKNESFKEIPDIINEL